jgi:hypothetical protein
MPSGSSGLSGFAAPAYALVRAALMNSAGSGQHEARWILSTDLNTVLTCPPELDPILADFCSIGAQIGAVLGNQILYEARNRAGDPFVGSLGEGAGKINLGRALSALRDGVVVYSVASGSGVDAGTGSRDLQGSWQMGATTAGASHTQSFVVHAAPGAARTQVRFSFVAGNPSDGSQAIAVGKNAWSIGLPSTVNVSPGGDAVVKFTAKVPTNAAPGNHTGTVVATASNGQVLRIPVYASVALHDASTASGSAGAQATFTSGLDVFGKSDTIWPSAAGAAGTGAGSDWLVFPVELAPGLQEARFRVYDAAAGDETYDLYLYGADYNLHTSTHPFTQPGVTDAVANSQRGPSTQASPQVLTLQTPSAGRHYVAVSRAKIGLLPGSGDVGKFVLTLDEVR